MRDAWFDGGGNGACTRDDYVEVKHQVQSLRWRSSQNTNHMSEQSVPQHQFVSMQWKSLMASLPVLMLLLVILSLSLILPLCSSNLWSASHRNRLNERLSRLAPFVCSFISRVDVASDAISVSARRNMKFVRSSFKAPMSPDALGILEDTYRKTKVLNITPRD